MNALQNLHYLFHHDYYKNLAESNQALTKRQFAPGSRGIPFAQQSFVLKTQYPGPLLGLGYPHDNGSGEPEIVKLGFSLDYVSGLPVIPGSTVKGVLRSLFRKTGAHEYTKNLGNLPSLDAVKDLEKALFDAESKDAYFDAYPITEKKPLLAFESITPHDKQNLKDPVPIRLLKVPPEVEFLFRFQLNDWEGRFSSEEKLDLFKELLKFTGIGAKTNVGFGGLTDGDAKGPYMMLEMCGAGAGQVRPAVQKEAGICGKCGIPTGKKADGTYHPFCYNCNQARGRN